MDLRTLGVVGLAALGLSACDRGGTAPETKAASATTEGPAWHQEEVVLYLPDTVMKQRVAVSDLSPYLKSVEAEAKAVIEAQPEQAGVSGMLLVMVKPGQRSKAWIVTGKPELASAISAEMIRRVETVPAVAVNGGPILVGLDFEAWGGGGKPAGAQAPIPRDWYSHFPKQGGRLDDALFAKVWPE